MGTYQHDTAGAIARRERNARIVDMLSSHSVLEVAEMENISASSVSQIAKRAGLPPRWGNGHGVGYIKPKELEVTIPPMVAEIVNRPKPQLPNCKLPPARAVGFAGYPGVYCRCANCFFSGWAKIGAETVCPRCKLPLQIVYTPGRDEP